jgi:CubicO group peptidase (beta-lactamase class C family)
MNTENNDTTEYSSALVDSLFAASGVPGLGTTIYYGGEKVFEKHNGLSDIDAQAPITPQTKFRIGSVSKAVTAIALLRLWQKGKIDLDEDIRYYVPEFSQKIAGITPRLLAGHLAGIRNYRDKDFTDSTHIDHRHFATTSEALKIFSNDSLVAKPGVKYHYSVFGYTLISAALENITKLDFQSLLEREVFEPLQLKNSGLLMRSISNMSTSYDRTSDGSPSISEPIDVSYKYAGGGMFSTSNDLALLGTNLLNPEFITSEALNLLITSQSTEKGESTNVSIGWRLGTDSRNRNFIHHAGSIAGGRAAILVYPKENISIAITSNQALAPLLIESTAQILAEPFLLKHENQQTNYIRPVGKYKFEWNIENRKHTGVLQYSSNKTNNYVDLPEELITWSERLGSPMDSTGIIFPVILSGKNGFIPIITSAGVFGIDVDVGRDSFTGNVTGQYLRVIGTFKAVRIGNE